jgi:hypothetical protein
MWAAVKALQEIRQEATSSPSGAPVRRLELVPGRRDLISAMIKARRFVMKHYSSSKTFVLAVSLLLITSSVCRAQSPKRPKSVQQETKRTAPVLSPTQQHGLENLDRIALEARQIDNPAVRTDLQALIGDALWDFDKPNARAIFVDAFKNAQAIEDKRQAADVQTEVVRHIWTRDRALAEELMKQLSSSKDQKNIDAADFGVSSQFGMRSSDPTTQQKLNLARDLIETEPAAARELISNSLEREVSFAGINLLTRLKAGDPEAANRIFLRAVGGLPSMPSTGAVLAAIAMADYVSPTCSLCEGSLDPKIAESYYTLALQTLRRSLGDSFAPPPVKPELQARLVQYFHEMQAMLALTLSRFAAPSDLGELQTIFRQQLQTLEPRKQQALQMMEQAQKAPDKFDDLARKLESIPDQEQRDESITKLVQLALRQDPTPELAGKLEEKIATIESKTLHDKAWSLLKVREVENLIKGGRLDEGYALSIKLPDPIIRAKALRSLSTAVARKGSATVTSPDLLTQALESLKEADPSIERSQIMFKIANDFVSLKDYDRAFDALQSSAGSLADLKKDDFAESNREVVPNSLFDYSGTFGRLGSVDFDKTTFLAQGIKWREFRLAAEIATCRSVLNKKRE